MSEIDRTLDAPSPPAPHVCSRWCAQHTALGGPLDDHPAPSPSDGAASNKQRAVELTRGYFGSMWGPGVKAETKLLTRLVAEALDAAEARGYAAGREAGRGDMEALERRWRGEGYAAGVRDRDQAWQAARDELAAELEWEGREVDWLTSRAGAAVRLRALAVNAGDSCGECCHVRASHPTGYCEECDGCCEFEELVTPAPAPQETFTYQTTEAPAPQDKEGQR